MQFLGGELAGGVVSSGMELHIDLRCTSSEFGRGSQVEPAIQVRQRRQPIDFATNLFRRLRPGDGRTNLESGTTNGGRSLGWGRSNVFDYAEVRKRWVTELGILNWFRRIWGQSIEERTKQLERQQSSQDSPEDKAAMQIDDARGQPDGSRDTKTTDRT